MKRSFAVVGFAYLAGLICAFLLSLNPVFNILALAFGLAAGLLLLKLNKPDVGVFLLIFGAAFGVFAFYQVIVLDKVRELDGETRSIKGTVIGLNSPSRDMAGYIIEADIDGVKTRFSLYAPDTGAGIGDNVSFDAAFSLLRNNTNFEEASYYMSKGVFIGAKAKTTPVAHKNESFSVVKLICEFNYSVRDEILSAFPNDTGALICAMFLGDRSSLSPALSSGIRRAGIAYYAAVSGLHMTIVTHLFMSLFAFTRLQTKRKLKFTFLVLLTLAFMVFFNLSQSVIRAGIMLIVYYGGELFMRRGNALNSVGFAALLILLFSPYACLDPGLLLSIAGTVGIGVVAPAINKRFERENKLREAFTANLCACYATLPLTALFFGGASLASPLTGVIVLPFFIILLTAMLLFALFALFALSGVFGGLPLLIAGIMARCIEIITSFFGGLKFAYIPLNYGFTVPWIIAAAAFVTFISLYCKNITAGMKAAGVTLFALAMMVIVSQYLDLDKTRLEIYTDGSSAAVFLRNRNHSVAVVTDDGVRVSRAVREFASENFLDEVGLLCVLNSTNNSLPYFAEVPSIMFSPPSDGSSTYDVGGVFTVKKSGDEVLIHYDGISISISHIKTSANADINITYNYSVHAAEKSGTVIHTSRRAEAEDTDEFNAYYERINWILGAK